MHGDSNMPSIQVHISGVTITYSKKGKERSCCLGFGCASHQPAHDHCRTSRQPHLTEKIVSVTLKLRLLLLIVYYLHVTGRCNHRSGGRRNYFPCICPRRVRLRGLFWWFLVWTSPGQIRDMACITRLHVCASAENLSDRVTRRGPCSVDCALTNVWIFDFFCAVLSTPPKDARVPVASVAQSIKRNCYQAGLHRQQQQHCAAATQLKKRLKCL